LWSKRLEKGTFTRTGDEDKKQTLNSTQLQCLIAGVYGGIIFHLGATSRAPVFHKELADNRLLAKTRIFNKIPLLYRIHSYFVTRITNKKIATNLNLLKKIKSQLIDNYEEFIKTIS
jgi:hypothetical protein